MLRMSLNEKAAWNPEDLLLTKQKWFSPSLGLDEGGQS